MESVHEERTAEAARPRARLLVQGVLEAFGEPLGRLAPRHVAWEQRWAQVLARFQR
jgi:hypothetical protein